MTPRILLAGTHSSAGKTTVALGLLRALRARGLRPAPFKVGPDYIDPGLHAQAAGRPSRNLDAWLLDDVALRGVLARGARDADLAVVEGVMGLFDGIGSGQEASTAAVARQLDCPVVLVLDVAAMSGTAAAVVLGCQRMRPGVGLVGVILNRAGGDAHAAATSEAIRDATGLPVLGWLPDDARFAVPERHLGLVTAAEGGVPEDTLERLGSAVGEQFDLEAILGLARAASPLPLDTGARETIPVRARIGVASDRAFGFYYEDTFDVLAQAGAEIARFSPLGDAQLPDGVDGLYLGGGFPELYAAELAENQPMRDAIRAFADAGRPVYAECGGLMALGESLTTFEGRSFPMFGLLPLRSAMKPQHSIGYCEVEALRACPLLEAGERARGHEFHWSEADPPASDRAAYRLHPSGRLEGYAVGSVLASYVHLSFAGAPGLATRFVASCVRGC